MPQNRLVQSLHADAYESRSGVDYERRCEHLFEGIPEVRQTLLHGVHERSAFGAGSTIHDSDVD